MNYYNEIDPFAAQWLRNLIQAGVIAPGVVDERSIIDVRPYELARFTQCHFFAGIGIWSLALRNAGWCDNRRVWTASCPCQPFSKAGKGAGFADERHLWPYFHYLVKECNPPAVIGEQVASKDAEPWIDLVEADMEALGYRFAAVAFPSAGIGGPHIRDRAYWVANSNPGFCVGTESSILTRGFAFDGSCAVHGVGHTVSAGLAQCVGITGISSIAPCTISRKTVERTGIHLGGVGDTRHHHDAGQSKTTCTRQSQAHRPANIVSGPSVPLDRPGPINGFWRNADWLGCTDGKWRPVEPGTSPLAYGYTQRVGQLRAYGNAINAEQARIFIESTGLLDDPDEL